MTHSRAVRCQHPIASATVVSTCREMSMCSSWPGPPGACLPGQRIPADIARTSASAVLGQAWTHNCVRFAPPTASVLPMDVDQRLSIDPVGFFAGELRRLRDAAGALSDRDLAQFDGPVSELPHSTISHWTSGKQSKVPTADFVSRYVSLCRRVAVARGATLSPQDANEQWWLTLRRECGTVLSAARKAAVLELADQWAREFDVAGWRIWTQRALCPPQGFPFAVQDRLAGAVRWLIGIEWPADFPRCAKAILNFRSVVCDLLDFFTASSIISERLDSFYEIRDPSPSLWRDPAAQQRAEREYVANLHLFTELIFELTAAANHVLKTVRSEIDRGFAGESLMATVEYGPTMEGRFESVSWEYEPDRARLERPYRGIDALRQPAAQPSPAPGSVS